MIEILRKLTKMAKHRVNCDVIECSDCKEIKVLFKQITNIFPHYPNPFLARYE